ncbi:MAG: hypothetical protein KGI28_02370 [Thaumarchaeota archaeon]|nr:hypothetical protein [Nitrososphaerota archaeon]
MKKVVCSAHNLRLDLPNIDSEFLSEHNHENIVKLQEHHELYPECRFVEEVQKQ